VDEDSGNRAMFEKIANNEVRKLYLATNHDLNTNNNWLITKASYLKNCLKLGGDQLFLVFELRESINVHINYILVMRGICWLQA
jgi:hypothetical protein